MAAQAPVYSDLSPVAVQGARVVLEQLYNENAGNPAMQANINQVLATLNGGLRQIHEGSQELNGCANTIRMGDLQQDALIWEVAYM